MNKPYIICHMTTSIDSKVTGDFLSHPENAKAVEAYYQLNRDYKADEYICGRVTLCRGVFATQIIPTCRHTNLLNTKWA